MPTVREHRVPRVGADACTHTHGARAPVCHRHGRLQLVRSPTGLRCVPRAAAIGACSHLASPPRVRSRHQ